MPNDEDFDLQAGAGGLTVAQAAAHYGYSKTDIIRSVVARAKKMAEGQPFVLETGVTVHPDGIQRRMSLIATVRLTVTQEHPPEVAKEWAEAIHHKLIQKQDWLLDEVTGKKRPTEVQLNTSFISSAGEINHIFFAHTGKPTNVAGARAVVYFQKGQKKLVAEMEKLLQQFSDIQV